MSASSVLLVAASIVAVEGGEATIDAGKSQHLKPGDQGQAFYELIVDGIPKRIDVGRIVVVSVLAGFATVSSEPATPLRPGYHVEFRLPVDPEPAKPIEPGISQPLREMPPSRPGSKPPQPVPDDYPEHTLPAVPVDPDPAPDELKRPVSAPAVPADPDPAADEMKRPVSVPAVPARDVVYVSSGSYSVGLDPSEAQFFNQTPRHEVMLSTYSIDRNARREEAASRTFTRPLTGVSFAEARAHCKSLGYRLPTEREWEVAAQMPGFVIDPDLFEWTDSWYQAYPGNSRIEEGYGESFRVLRGTSDWSAESLHTRRFMNPELHNAKVGFRCVRDIE